MAGYSLDEDIESRLISCFDDEWLLEHGPLEETRFAELPEQDWTLLVQSLDYFHPPLQELIKACNFIPRWRLDDVMVSFATNNGGVGAHIDQYDVFLIQGTGKRRWRVGHKNQTIEAVNTESGISQIKPFVADLDIEIEVGDLLYIPPNTPHWGESIGDSICYSVGFRAPNLEAITQQLLEEANQEIDQLWQDENLLSNKFSNGQLPNEISNWATTEIQKIAQSTKMHIAIGKEVTSLKYPELIKEINLCEAEELAEIAFFKAFQLTPFARFAFFNNNNQLLVFANGEQVNCNRINLPLLEKLNNYQSVFSKDFNGDNNKTRQLLTELFLVGAIEIIEK